MDILVITAYYLPDGGPAAPLYTMLCEALAQRGHHVDVITAVPHYPSGKVPESYRGKFSFYSIEKNVRVRRMGLPSVNRAKLSDRLLQFVVFQFRSTYASWKTHYDILLTHSPSLETWLPFACHTVIRRKPAIYSVHDVYPDIGISLGIFHKGPALKILTAMEKFCLNHACKVRILSKSFITGLERLGIPQEKITLLYDWADMTAISPLPRTNSFAREQGLTDGFVVLYAGNIGLSQGLEFVLDAARLLSEQPDINFVFIGEGSGKPALMERAKSLDLGNVRFLPFQPRERLSEVLATADVSLVSLKRGSGGGSLPSKTYSIMASERPIIASVDQDSDTWDLIQRAGCGVCIPPGNPELIAEAIISLRRDEKRRLDLGKTGRQYALAHHSSESAAVQFEELFQQVINEHDY